MSDKKAPRDYGPGLKDPAIKAKAAAAQAAHPPGKHNTKMLTIDVPGAWGPEMLSTLGYNQAPKARQAQANMAYAKLEILFEKVVETATQILSAPGNDAAKVQLIGKILDKMLPDLMTKPGAVAGQSTKIVFGMPLERLRSAEVAVEVRTESEEANGHAGDGDQVSAQPELDRDPREPL